MASERQRIEAFWDWFTKNEVELLKLEGTAEPFWDIALKRIKKVDENLWFEVSREREPVREFIVTADAHVKSFPIAERLVRLGDYIAWKKRQGGSPSA
jgi:hypothetical protein